MLTTTANDALAMTVTVPGGVEASVSDGNVWLTGMVGNRFERDAERFSRIAGEASRAATGYMAGNCVAAVTALRKVVHAMAKLRPSPTLMRSATPSRTN